MKPDTPLPGRGKDIRPPDKALLWIAAFTALAALCFILALTVRPWIFKLLFLILGLGAAAYIWVMVESRRITPKPGQAASPSSPARDAPAAQESDDAPQLSQAADAAGPDEQDKNTVFISDKGDKFHRDRQCVGLRFADSVQIIPLEQAESLGRKPCSKCRPKESKA